MSVVALNRRQSLMSRRDVVFGASAVLGASWLSPAGAQGAAQGLRRRQSVSAADGKDLDTYRKAIEVMLGLDAKNPHNWYRQALIHLIDCPHGNWWFLPWHRGYLSTFEAICGKHGGDAGFALPFWDWTTVPEIPSTFFEGILNPAHAAFEKNPDKLVEAMGPGVKALLETASPAQKEWLDRSGLNSETAISDTALRSLFALSDGRSLTADNPKLGGFAAQMVGETRLRAVVGASEFDLFGSYATPNHYEPFQRKGGLESGAHDNVHGEISGAMGAMLSPIDPIFWLHHCNVDRLWSLWLKKQAGNGRPGNPTSAAWLDEPFAFFHGADETLIEGKACKDFIDSAALGYDYGPGALDDVASVTLASAASSAAVIASAAPDTQSLRTFRETAAAIRLDSRVLRQAAAPRPADDAPATDLLAKVTFTPPSDPSVRVRVFANCPYLSAFTKPKDPHFVGQVAFFGANQKGHHGGQAVSYLLPLDPTLKALKLKRRSVQSQLKLQFLAVDKSNEVRELEAAVTNIEIIEA